MGFHILDKGDESSAFTKFVMNILNGLAGCILKVCDLVEKIPTKLPEMLAMLAYTVLHFVMMIYHEPWFDEAEAWQITRSASIREILFEIPHYEGHTPLWDLILLPFAKGGAPYELSLSIVSFIFSGGAVALIIYKAPWKRIVRILLPFTYFFCYQYGVISRPYCVMMLAFVLMGMCYKSRNERPGRYVLSMMLLALTFPMGLLLAGGIAIVWLVQIMDEVDIRLWLKDRRLLWLLFLAIVALISLVQIMPRDNTYATTPIVNEDGNSIWLKIIYVFLALPSDLIITNAWWDQGKLAAANINVNTMIVSCLLGIIFWCLLITYGKKKKKLALVVVPYVAYALFCSFVYMSNHHMGVALLLFMFWFWVTSEEESVTSGKLFKLSDRDKKAIFSCLVIFAFLCMMTSIWWTVASCITDIESDYAAGRKEAEFIKEYALDKYNILAEYEVHYDENEDVISYDLNYTYHTPNVLAYFDDNIFYNMKQGYIEHKRLNGEEEKCLFNEIRKKEPEVLFGVPDLNILYGRNSTYSLVYAVPKKKAWKSTYDLSFFNIYVRDDLLEEIGLQEMQHVKSEWVPVG